MKSNRILTCLMAGIIAAAGTFGNGSPLALTCYAATVQTAEPKYTITEAELDAAGVTWQGAEAATVYARVTKGGMDSKISASAWLGELGKVSTKRISGRNVMVGNAIQDNVIGLAGSGIYEFPELNLKRTTTDGSEWQESYDSEITIEITIDTVDTDFDLLGIKFDNGALYAFEEGFSPENVKIEGKGFDVIEKTERDWLKITLDYCKSLDEKLYQPQSWQELQDAVAEAEAVYAKEGESDDVYISARTEIHTVKSKMLFADTATAENPLPFRELSKEQLIFEMGVGINLGNTLDGHGNFSPNETSWQSVRTTKAYIDALHDAGYNTVRVPVTWGTTIDRDTYEISERWINRVEEIVDYCISQDMYVIINIHHDGAEQQGWLRVAADDIDAVYEKFEYVWRNIAERFKDYDEHLIFESMNEITCMKDDLKNSPEAVAYDTPIIVRLNQIFVNVVRSTGSNNETRWLAAVAHYANNGSHEAFELPVDVNAENPHIMFGAHIYKSNTNVTWTYDEVYKVVEGLKLMADKFDVPMYLGEYGNRTKEQEGTATGYNDIARAYFSEVVHRACQTAGVVPIVWDQGYGDKGKYETGLFTYWDREQCVPLFKTITDAMIRGTYLPNSELNAGWDYTDVIENPEIIPITSITLSADDVQLTIGETETITAETAPANSNDAVIWSTDDESVATVTRGIIRARGIGITTIRAYTLNGTVTREIKVTVNAAAGSAEISAPEELTIETGRAMLLGASLPDGAEGWLTYESSNPNVVTVSPTGRAFAVGTGAAYVTVTSSGGASKVIRIYAPEDEDTPETKSDISVTADRQYSAVLGQNSTVRVKASAAGAIVCFVSGDSNVAAVQSIASVADENGYVYATVSGMQEGSAVITAIAENGAQTTFTVNIAQGSGLSPVIWICIAAAVVVIAVASIAMLRKKKKE